VLPLQEKLSLAHAAWPRLAWLALQLAKCWLYWLTSLALWPGYGRYRWLTALNHSAVNSREAAKWRLKLRRNMCGLLVTSATNAAQ